MSDSEGAASSSIVTGSTLEDLALLSLIIPVYRNEDNVPELIAALRKLNASLGNRLQVVFVIDGSPDESGKRLLEARPSFDFASLIVFHSRNFGSFTAIRTGLEIATGKYFAVMAADLQEPTDLVPKFFEILETDHADVVFGQRKGRSDPPLQRLLSGTFWWLYRHLAITDVPKGGVDVFACNRTVRNVLLLIREPNSSLIAQLFWIGFRREFVPYYRNRRQLGKSAWKFSRRLRYMMDSIFSYSDLPILFVLWVGIAGCICSFVYALVLLFAYAFGSIDQPGYVSLVLFIVFFGSASLAVQGILGCYLWRTFENTKQRPLQIISRIVGGEDSDPV